MDTMVRQDRVNMTEAEWQARCDLAALYRVTDLYGWTDTINTHMSVRIADEPNCFLINNYGDLFHEITASSLVKMDLDGKVYSEDGSFNAAGFTIHSGVYKARPDANCVMHTHTRAGTGISVLKKGLRPISQDALSVLDDVVYHEYGMPTSQEECDALGVTLPGRQFRRAAQPRASVGRRHRSRRIAPALHAGARLRGRDHRPRPRRSARTDRGRMSSSNTPRAPRPTAPRRNSACPTGRQHFA